VKPHDHREADQRRWTLDGLRAHVRQFHGSLQPGKENASFRTLAAAHRRDHGEPEPLSDRGNLLTLDEAAPQGLHSRISLEFSHTWPGQCYLRFEAASGAVTMVAVNAADLQTLRRLLEVRP
jgi:hypothetical protein